MIGGSRTAVLLLAVAAVLPAPSSAERLPVRRYTTADGLPHDRVKCIVPDSLGYLWFCTVEGLSRFDGYGFTTYTTADGLPNPSANHVVEDGPGLYWVASNGGGVCRFTAADTRCRNYPVGDSLRSNRVNVVLPDRRGRVWAGSDAGVFRLDRPDGTFAPVPLGLPPGEPPPFVRAFEEDDGGIWIATSAGLLRADADGRIAPAPLVGGPLGRALSLARDGAGRVWVGSDRTIVVFVPPRPGEPIVVRDRPYEGDVTLPASPGEAGRFQGPPGEVDAIFTSSRGDVWIGVREGRFLQFDGRRFHEYPPPPGLRRVSAICFGEDQAGNVWAGTSAGGALKLPRSGFTTFDEDDGLSGDWIVGIFEDERGALHVVTRIGTVNRLDRDRFVPVVPNVPQASVTDPVLRSQFAVPDREGAWWARSSQGLFRFRHVDRLEALAAARADERYTVRDGLPSDVISRVFVDAAGDVWIGTYPDADGTVLARWERATRRIARVAFPPRAGGWSPPLTFADLGSAGLWIGLNDGGLVRVRDGRAQALDVLPPPARALAIHRDAAGRVWLAAEQNGLARIDDPSAERPTAVFYSTPQGLGSSNVTSIAEDRWGRLYVGTQGGVDRLDPQTGHVKHYSTADGLAQNEVKVAYADRQGALWFGTVQGVSRFVPEPDPPTRVPRVRIGGVRVAGEPRRLSALGETSVDGVVLPPDTNQLQIDFGSVSLGPGDVVRYQYRLEGDRDWSVLGRARSVNYAGLPAGRHVFQVRAVNADGVASDPPARVVFTVRAPFWRRAWFLAAVALLLLALGRWLYRARVRRLLELERVRTGIATDLHDDIGSSLSKIAILSEVARAREGPHPDAGALASIADISRELVDSMSDIVWAVNPHRDSLRDLSQRMRAFASDIFAARDVVLRFDAPAEAVPVAADVRRQVFLIFKEAVNNAASHAKCRSVQVELALDSGRLALRVADDGVGLNGGPGDGHGLASMDRRARAMGGALRIASEPGHGTTVLLSVPLKGKRRRPWARAERG